MKKQPPPTLPQRTSRSQRQLKNFLINPAYQIRYVIILNLIGLMMFASTAIVFYLAMKTHLSTIIDNDVVLQAGLQPAALGPMLLALAVVFTFVTTLIGIYISHKTAGPMYRFRVSFDQVRKGDFNLRIKLRPGDDFQEVATGFNQMMDTVQSKVEK